MNRRTNYPPCYVLGMKVRLGSLADMPADNTAAEIECAGNTYCVAQSAGQFSVMDNVCPHRGGPLGTGVIDGAKLICPWHGWQFDPATGKAIQVPGAGVRVYPLTIEGDDVFIEI